MTASLTDVIANGLQPDIFEAERAYALVKSLARHSQSIDSDPRNFALFLATTQQIAHHTMLLALARVYDRPSQRFPTLSLLKALDLLTDSSHTLPKIVQRSNLAKALTHLSNEPSDALLVENGNDTEIRNLIARRIRSAIDAPQVRSARDELKTVRDKRLAHTEHVSSLTTPSWASFEQLLSLSQKAVGVLGWAYTATGYIIGADYVLSPDAQRPTLSMERLLRELNIEPQPRG